MLTIIAMLLSSALEQRTKAYACRKMAAQDKINFKWVVILPKGTTFPYPEYTMNMMITEAFILTCRVILMACIMFQEMIIYIL